MKTFLKNASKCTKKRTKMYLSPKKKTPESFFFLNAPKSSLNEQLKRSFNVRYIKQFCSFRLRKFNFTERKLNSEASIHVLLTKKLFWKIKKDMDKNKILEKNTFNVFSNFFSSFIFKSHERSEYVNVGDIWYACLSEKKTKLVHA